MSTNANSTSHVTSQTVQRGFRPAGRGSMGAPVEKPKEGKKTAARLAGYFASERVYVILLAVTVIAAVLVSVTAPGLQSRAIDGLVSRDFDRIPPVLAAMIFLYMIHAAATLLQGYFSAQLSRHVVRRVREELFAKVIRLPVSYLDAHSHGDIMSRMTNDAENVSNVISQSLSSMFSGVLTLIGTVIVMLLFSVPLTLLTCTTVILSVAATRIMSALMRKYYLKRQTLLGALNGIVQEKVTACRTVTAYNLQEETIAEFDRAGDELTRTGIIADIIGNAMGPVMNMLNNCSFVIVAAFGAWFALRGMISVGVISAFIIYSKQFSRPINELAQLFGQIQTAIAGAERIFSILDEESEDRSGTQPMPASHGVIEFRHVDFSYVPGKQIIYDFNLKVEAGKKIALVGSTGSGKTTIVNSRYFLRPAPGQHRNSPPGFRPVHGHGPCKPEVRGSRDFGRADDRGGEALELRQGGGGAAGRLRHGPDRCRFRTFPGAAAAAHHRPGFPFLPGDPDPGRSDLQRRHPHRTADPERDGAAHEGPHQPDHRAPAFHDPRRGYDRGHGSRAYHRDRKPRGAAGEAGDVLRPLHDAVRRPGDIVKKRCQAVMPPGSVLL